MFCIVRFPFQRSDIDIICYFFLKHKRRRSTVVSSYNRMSLLYSNHKEKDNEEDATKALHGGLQTEGRGRI